MMQCCNGGFCFAAIIEDCRHDMLCNRALLCDGIAKGGGKPFTLGVAAKDDAQSRAIVQFLYARRGRRLKQRPQQHVRSCGAQDLICPAIDPFDRLWVRVIVSEIIHRNQFFALITYAGCKMSLASWAVPQTLR